MPEGVREWVKMKCTSVIVYNSKTMKIWNSKDIYASLRWEMEAEGKKKKLKNYHLPFSDEKIEKEQFSNLVTVITHKLSRFIPRKSDCSAPGVSYHAWSVNWSHFNLLSTVGRCPKTSLRVAVEKEEEMDDDTVMAHLEAERGLGKPGAQGSLEREVTGWKEGCLG